MQGRLGMGQITVPVQLSKPHSILITTDGTVNTLQRPRPLTELRQAVSSSCVKTQQHKPRRLIWWITDEETTSLQLNYVTFLQLTKLRITNHLRLNLHWYNQSIYFHSSPV